MMNLVALLCTASKHLMQTIDGDARGESSIEVGNEQETDRGNASQIQQCSQRIMDVTCLASCRPWIQSSCSG